MCCRPWGPQRQQNPPPTLGADVEERWSRFGVRANRNPQRSVPQVPWAKIGLQRLWGAYTMCLLLFFLREPQCIQGTSILPKDCISHRPLLLVCMEPSTGQCDVNRNCWMEHFWNEGSLKELQTVSWDLLVLPPHPLTHCVEYWREHHTLAPSRASRSIVRMEDS